MVEKAVTAPFHSGSWSEGPARQIPPLPDRPTQFEELVDLVGLGKRPDLWRHNDRLRRFARVHKSTRYVPEWFLAQLGLSANWEPRP